MGDQKTEDRPQTQQRPGEQQQQPQGGRDQAQQRPQRGQQNPQSGGDHDKVGEATDGDGKVVKPGLKPGQSGGQGFDK